MILASQFKEGSMFINENGQMVEVMTVQHHRKSQARAVVRVKLTNIETGSIIETAYRPEDKFKDVMVEKRPKTYVYAEADMAYFMDDTTFEQVGMPKEKIKAMLPYMTENMAVEGIYLNDAFFTIQLPANLVMTVTHTVDGVRGDTVSNTMKDATVNTGLVVKVPMFINEGDQIRVDTRTGTYVERVSK
ncbi:MAG: elongation factor P [Elusimicrobia bacterium GWA2_64_40]|nr:MAG: elongation factor P [Elusimicrobia bacterium GWA2_64_40]OGR65168.1 MAG: elongation factor P [Elusimicrobia bacterium GWB2_63_16]HAN05661.1 elongation factor P [Elusimicrobiota bacterium]